MTAGDPVRIGTLGAARITPVALTKPARRIEGATVVGVAARDRARATEFASKHGIPQVFDSYEALIESPDIDAIYNPLPNGLHAEWTLAAIAAGKHVLCEKPFTNNAAEARMVAEAAAAKPELVVMEAFHYRYHPFAEQMRAVAAGTELGRVEHVETWVSFPLFRFNDIRYRYDLGGGAMMDAGCYATHIARLLAGGEPTVTGATAKRRGPDVDRAMKVDVTFPSGATGRINCSMWSTSLLHVEARVRGDRGEMRVRNPIAPHMFGRLTVKANGTKRRERAAKRPTYEYQLEAFCAAVRERAPILTPPADSIANMTVIDAAYIAAGMKPRGT
ncbi:MAG: binding oxidoreductase [Actinomycetia bacterium]|nr:binding oxidoreductase [Actinomycetes bacterium]